jgi:1,4-alpha-glucan branching enzyme
MDLVKKETGLNIEIISPQEESRLAVVGCVPLLNRNIKRALVFDIGGGSTELAGYGNGKLHGFSMPMGAVRWMVMDAKREEVKRMMATSITLNRFDNAMIQTVLSERRFEASPVVKVWENDGDQILAFSRKDLLFVFNFHPNKSYTDYGMLVKPGSYEVVLNSDREEFGGFNQIDDTIEHFTHPDPLYKKARKEWLKLYIPSRTVLVLRRKK